MELDPLRAVRVVHRCRVERSDHLVDRVVRDLVPGHVIELDEDVLVLRIGAHLRQVDVDRAVAVRVHAVLLPAVRQPVAIGVRRVLGLALRRQQECVLRVDAVITRGCDR